MNKELKKAIINWVFTNEKMFQINNTCIANFRQYIYTENGEYCFGGRKVLDFIKNTIKLIKE